MSYSSMNQNPVRCFCSFIAKQTSDKIFVCGQYKSGGMVCLFHLHDENIQTFYQPNIFSMNRDCEKCLATIKIKSKEYIAPCRIPSVRCHCGDTATFYQSKKENENFNAYFFGCPNWQTRKCNFFKWCHEYQTIRDIEILNRLLPSSSSSENLTKSRKRALDEDDNDTKQKDECVICLANERSHLITPCNHLCCCSTCAKKIQGQCPICRKPIESIQRIFLA